MKTKFSKRILSLFLAVMMVVTSIPMFALTASAGVDGAKYLFAYFTGNSKYGQQIRFALSDDGYNFTALNNNKPVVKQAKGESDTSAGYARDPYIFRDSSGSGYWMIATDMDAGPGGMHESWDGDSCIVVWHSDNLTNWEQVSCFDFRSFSGFEGTIRAWAPQVFFDAAKNQYMVYLSISKDGDWNQMYYTYTTDFKTFTTPVKFEFSDGVKGRIDADIVENNGTYYMYYKDETAAKVLVATSSSLTGPYTYQANVSANLSSKEVEGNAMYQIGNSDTWVIMLDEYLDGSFAYGTTTDFINFTKYTGSTANNAALTARHGSVMQITDEEYNTLVGYTNWMTSSGVKKVYYNFNEAQSVYNSGWTYNSGLKDTSNAFYDVMVSNRTGSNGSYVVGNGGITLSSSNVFINDGDARSLILSDNFAIAFSHKRNGETVGNYNFANDGYVMGISNGNVDYLRVTESGKLSVLVNGSLVESQSSVSIETGKTQEFIITYDGTKTCLYIDGVLAASVTGKMDAPVAWVRVENNETKTTQPYTGFGYTDLAGNVMANATFFNPAFYSTVFPYGDIEETMNAFEAKMKNVSSTVAYTNMGKAYKAYVNLQKAYDAVTYGARQDVDLAYYVTALKYAVDSMKQITNGVVSTNYTPSWGAESGYYSNILWADSSISASSEKEENWVYVTTQFRSYANVVLLNDGGTMKYPVTMSVKKGTLKRDLDRVIGSSTNYSLGQDWKGYNELSGDGWPSSSNATISSDSNGDTSLTVDFSTRRFYKCFLTRNISENTTSYYDTDSSVTFNIKNGRGSTCDNALSNNVYTLNYLTLKNQLTSKYTNAVKNAVITASQDIANYSEGGAMDVFNIANCLVDPTFYSYSSDTDTAVKEIASLLKQKTEEINSLTSNSAITKDSTNYKDLRSEMDDFGSNYSDTQKYTSESLAEYKKIYDASVEIMADVLSNGYTNKDVNAGLNVEALRNVLNSILDKSALQAEIANKDNSVIFDESGNQTKTYASWKTVYSALKAAKLLDETVTNRYSTEIGNYANVTQTDLKYNKTTTDNTQAVTDATTNLQNANLVDIDTVGYPSFDAAKTVVDSIDRAKYTTSALEAFDRAVSNAKDLVYYTPTADEISAYNDNTEGTDITGDLKISTSLTNTDAATIALLNAVNTLNTVNEDGTQPNVNKYSAKIYDSDRNYKETISKYYGDTFKYNVGETLEDDDVVTWVVTVYANDTDLEKATADEPDPTVKPIRSQVVSNYNGITIERTANGSMCIQYIIDKGTAVDQLTYKIYNAYGNVIDVLYGSEGAYDDAYFRANYPDPVLPFYSFTGWDVSDAVNGVVKVKPVFDETPTKTVTVDTNYATISFNKMSGGKAIVGATATITGNLDNIYGWAVATDGKYQIVGYGKNYKFNVFADESYVPIIKTESGYQINGTDLTANMVAGFSNNSNGNLSDAAYLAAKLTAKAPFVYYQTNSDFYDKGVSKTKVYVRITAGSGIDNLAYGLQINGNKFVSTAKNEGGQFYMTMKTASYNGVTENNMSAYVSYTFPYTFKDETAYITTIDYAKIK